VFKSENDAMAREKSHLKDSAENLVSSLGNSKEPAGKVVEPAGKELEGSRPMILPNEHGGKAMNLRARSISAFCKRWDIGRTTVYAEIKEKRLKAHKVRGRTIITVEAEDEWSRALPEVGDETSA
jgi:hypothetical protein